MTSDPDYLIVYGTLRPAFQNRFARYLRRHSRCVGEGTFSGLLFDVGDYPGALYQKDNVHNVHGTIYDISHHKRLLLAYLDDYEGLGAHSEQPHEYIREVVPVDCKGRSIACWTYLYNLLPEDKPVIASGDYPQYVGC